MRMTMVRARRSRAALVSLVAALLGTAAVMPASAAERSAPATVAGPGGLPAAEQPIAPPAPALAEVRLIVSDETTGSVPGAPGEARAVPPALSFEEGAPAKVAPAAADAALPVTPPVAPDAPAAIAAAPVEASIPAAAPASSVAAALAAALSDFQAAKVPGDSATQAIERQKSRAAIAAFYTAHADQPLWIADGRLTPAARSALARLDHAAEDALDLARDAVPVPRDSDTWTLVTAELALSEATVAYARQAGGSRVDVAHLGGVIDLRPDLASADRILSVVPLAADAGEALRSFNPPQPGYAALRDKLAELRRSATADASSRIPAGPVLKPGMRDARVPLIRARFGLDVASVEPGVPPLVYDTRVAAAVADFQRAHGLPASGQLTPSTVAALSGGNPIALENTIVANMELWRWQPRETAPDRVEVNIPDYTARVMRDGAVVHQTRVVVGQPEKPTPVFAEQMRFIIVNPYWNVPLSILKTEMMPKLAANPNYFADHGYEVVERDGVRYVRQPPGDGNALGRIKFMFPNTHSVYLHDTNARSFFARDKRALSHGCVRVEQPFSFAEAVLGAGWPEARIRKLIGGQERTINLQKPLPILITYFTAFVDPQQGFQLRDDVYGYAGRVKTALNLQD